MFIFKDLGHRQQVMLTFQYEQNCVVQGLGKGGIPIVFQVGALSCSRVFGLRTSISCFRN
jgi:hypothetical protein